MSHHPDPTVRGNVLALEVVSFQGEGAFDALAEVARQAVVTDGSPGWALATTASLNADGSHRLLTVSSQHLRSVPEWKSLLDSVMLAAARANLLWDTAIVSDHVAESR